MALTNTAEPQPIVDSWEMPVSRRGTPTWEMAIQFPIQGEWTEEQYLNLDTNRLVEFKNGVLEFLPMPGPAHFRLSRFLIDALRSFVESRKLGEVFWAPYSVRTIPNCFREPDLGFLATGRIPTDNTPPEGADLVIEIVSAGTSHRRRYLQEKRTEYAAAAIPEYWIVDPEFKTITVLVLEGNKYAVHGEFKPGTLATSRLLSGFEVDVKACLDSAKVHDE